MWIQIKQINEGLKAKVYVNGKRDVCSENQDEYVRTADWKILTDDADTVNTKGK